jgi:para-aminobenzoate synthetase
MRILLIDNYDSFTWNLFQLIAQVTGDQPAVIRNDEWSLERILEENFDRIIISPGPGAPSVPRDFGVCADVLRHATCPILGVCLGHQGLGYVSGARVRHAPVPMHGRLSRICHDGKGILRGLPSPFSAVRYHSLVVSDVPESLECIAWTEDHLVMGLQHRVRPVYGVQFHPESICTEFGAQLVSNFADGPPPARRAVSRPRQQATTRRAGPPARRFRIAARRVEFACDAEVAFRALFAGRTSSFWLDSSRAEPHLARFSFMGDAEGRCGSIVTYSIRDRAVTKTDCRSCQTYSTDIFSYLKEKLGRLRIDDPPELPFPFRFGFVGYVGYEVRPEAPARHGSEHPDAMFIQPARMVAVDHQQQQLWLQYLVESPEDEAAAVRWFDSAEASLRAASPPPIPALPLGKRRVDVEMRLDISADAYLERIARCLAFIRDGEAYELCLTNKLRIAGHLDPLTFYSALRRWNPAPYAAFFERPGLAIACSSPECFLKVAADGRVETKPVKGTARRAADPDQDALIRHALQTDEKTRAENLMIVDLLRNDLGRVCRVGSVHVAKLMDIESYATVHQMVSTIRGTLCEGATAVECIEATFPGGSMTGAPKLRAMQILEELEGAARGIYSGAIGFFGLDGQAMFNIVIRTAIITGEETTIGAGGAIVALSDPVSELHETFVKLEPLVTAYSAAVGAPCEALHDTLWSFAAEPAAMVRSC